MCALLSVAGLSPHHHATAQDELQVQSQVQSICLLDDVGLDDQSTVPCSESCLFHLGSATSPTVSNLPVPIIVGADTLFTLSESLLRIEPASQVHFIPSLPHSTDIRKRLLASPSVTGRFLI